MSHSSRMDEYGKRHAYVQLLNNSMLIIFLSTTFIKLSMGFVQRTITKMAAKTATACRFALMDALDNLIIYHLFASKFHKWIFYIKILPNSNVCFVQDGVRLSARANLATYHPSNSLYTTVPH